MLRTEAVTTAEVTSSVLKWLLRESMALCQRPFCVPCCNMQQHCNSAHGPCHAPWARQGGCVEMHKSEQQEEEEGVRKVAVGGASGRKGMH